MKLQYITSCALCMMAYLAGQKEVINSRELEEKIGFPQQCIFNAARRLKKSGYLDTVSGPHGGYTLGKPAGKITVQDILALFNDSFSICCDEVLALRNNGSIPLRNVAKRMSEWENENIKKMSELTLASLLKEPAFSNT